LKIASSLGKSDAMTAVFKTVAEWREFLGARRKKGQRIALVPTMGALHEGHVSLINLGKQHAQCVVATIFVNPTQFAANEDFSRYPRPFEADLTKLAAAGCDAVFVPSVEEMYPPGDATRITVAGPALAKLDDVFRPTHFDGVATVVAKLLLQAMPDGAIFGEKDWQQLAVIRQMVRDLMVPVAIIGAPTLRAADGLALSSRNMYLSSSERAKAPAIHQCLQNAAAAIRNGVAPGAATAEATHALRSLGFAVDYVTARHATSLQPVTHADEGPIRLLAAAKIGTTRLIDTIGV
jgi:pantoate--beta-alanine ligase